MPNKIEKIARDILIKKLKRKGCNVDKSADKTFDLIVDGEYAEVKSKGKPFEKIDFISFTEKQYNMLQKKDYDIYLVCNVLQQDENKIEIFKFSTRDLVSQKTRTVTSYEFDRSAINKIKKKRFYKFF